MKTMLASFVVLFALGATPVQADTLVVDKVVKDQQADVQRPSRGMTMQAVSRQFGEPGERVAAVGEPPIARWVYGEYVVYFEKDRVLHTVLRR